MSEVYGYIYEVVNKVNNKVYVGQTTNSINRRWDAHKSAAKHRSPNGYKSALHSAICKYGVENFTIEVLTTASSKEELDRLEQTYIEGLNAMAPFGYNLKTGGANGKNIQSQPKSEQTKKKISASLKGHTVDQNTRQKISDKLKGTLPVNTLSIIDSLGRVYPSAEYAARELGLKNASNITSVLKGRRKTAGGLTFQYYQPNQNQDVPEVS